MGRDELECFTKERLELGPRVAPVAELRRAIQRCLWISVGPGVGYWEGTWPLGWEKVGLVCRVEVGRQDG